MGALTIGLTAGFAIAGGAIGFFGSIAGGFLGAIIGGLSGDRRFVDNVNPVKDGLVGTFIGAAAGLGLGFTIETAANYLNPPTTQPVPAIAQHGDVAADCMKRLEQGQSVTLAKTAEGQYVCVIKPQP
jgi:hypothetical protein